MPLTKAKPSPLTISIHSDGASQGNPGLAGAGAVLEAGANLLETISAPLGVMTCNQAEYNALLLALKAALRYKPDRINCYLDSELVVRQLNGEYRVRDATLRVLHQQIIELIKHVSEVTFVHITRELNAQADNLATRAVLAQRKARRRPS